jgi:hypothetical protein
VDLESMKSLAGLTRVTRYLCKSQSKQPSSLYRAQSTEYRVQSTEYINAVCQQPASIRYLIPKVGMIMAWPKSKHQEGTRSNQRYATRLFIACHLPPSVHHQVAVCVSKHRWTASFKCLYITCLLSLEERRTRSGEQIYKYGSIISMGMGMGMG